MNKRKSKSSPNHTSHLVVIRMDHSLFKRMNEMVLDEGRKAHYPVSVAAFIRRVLDEELTRRESKR